MEAAEAAGALDADAASVAGGLTGGSGGGVEAPGGHGFGLVRVAADVVSVERPGAFDADVAAVAEGHAGGDGGGIEAPRGGEVFLFGGGLGGGYRQKYGVTAGWRRRAGCPQGAGCSRG